MIEPLDTEIACAGDGRRVALLRGKWNGIDSVDVSTDQMELCVHFIAGIPSLTPRNFVIRGGTHVTDVRVTQVNRPPITAAAQDACLSLRLNKRGDFSAYTLCVVKVDANGEPREVPPDGFDPFYSCVPFSFKANCPADIDCGGGAVCPPPDRHEPEIDYLARDFNSFRQLMLDRLALIMPEWRERHIPDVGIALVELLAYTGDYLSYFIDAVATEAYIDTARMRISVRRHARLVGYQMHEGCNARAWIVLETSSDATLEGRVAFATEWPGAPAQNPVPFEALSGATSDSFAVFEPLAPALPIDLVAAHNAIPIYTWGNDSCCIEKGATSVWLTDQWASASPPQKTHGQKRPARKRKLRIRRGQFLLFEEVLCASTGVAADADARHRHVVRVTRVEEDVDPVFEQPIVRVSWADDDALPFAMCVSAVGPAPDCRMIGGITVARGNVVLADHGRSYSGIDVGTVPAELTRLRCDGAGDLEERSLRAARFRPVIERAPLTFRARVDESAPASQMLRQEPRDAVAQLTLRAIPAAPLDAVFDPADDDDPQALASLASRVRDARDRAAQTLRRNLSDETIDLLERWDGTGPLPAAAREELLQDLRRLSLDGVPPEPLFDPEDLVDPRGFAARLQQNSDAGAKMLRAHLQPETLDAIDALKPGAELSSELRETLAHLLDTLIENWLPQFDLLGSAADDRDFVAEIDDDGRTHLRFGDDQTGREPEPGTAFLAEYRIGNGASGNVGAESITRLLMAETLAGVTISLRNPLPAAGGRSAEPVDEVRALAPTAFRRHRQRAVTAPDYAELAGVDAEWHRDRDIQKAAAMLAWNGSWPVARVSIDPAGRSSAGPTLRERVLRLLHRYRRMGHDVTVSDARYVPLDLRLEVCVLPHYTKGDVRAALLDVFSNRQLVDGRRGFFHPDNLTFGDDIRISRIVAAAQAVEGVRSVTVTQLTRLFGGTNPDFAGGILRVDPLEVARLDNDPSRPENGLLKLTMRGGR